MTESINEVIRNCLLSLSPVFFFFFPGNDVQHLREQRCVPTKKKPTHGK